MEAAAKNLTPILLELGGQNPAFVDPTAKFRTRPRNCLGRDVLGRPMVYFSGLCVCHESVVDQFVEESKKP